MCVCVFMCVFCLCAAAGLLAGLHADDPVPACGILLHCGLHPDDRLGQGQAPQLPERVPPLPHPPLPHTALRALDTHTHTHTHTHIHTHTHTHTPDRESDGDAKSA